MERYCVYLLNFRLNLFNFSQASRHFWTSNLAAVIDLSRAPAKNQSFPSLKPMVLKAGILSEANKYMTGRL